MKPSSYLTIAILALAISTTTACGSSDNTSTADSTTVSDRDTEPIDYTGGAEQLTPDQLDQLIMSPDDLTPGQAVGALHMLHSLINNATESTKEINMRKFVDLYGIVLEIHGDNLRDAMSKLKARTGMDIATIYADYSATLKVGDEVGSGNPDEATEGSQTDEATIDGESVTDEPETGEPTTTVVTNDGASITTVGE